MEKKICLKCKMRWQADEAENHLLFQIAIVKKPLIPAW